jgi:myosin heavy chain 6/7
MLSDNIMDYYFVAQGKTTIPGVDDGEESELTDVRFALQAIVIFVML